MGRVAILDRFRQIEPKVLIVQDGYTHAGKEIDRRSLLQEIRAGLPSVQHTLWVPVAGEVPKDALAFGPLTQGDATYQSTPVPFDHLPIPVCGRFERPFLALVIHMDQSEAFPVALGPLKIVHEGPMEVTREFDAILMRL